MTLDESVDGLSKLSDSGIDFYLDPKLVEFIAGKGSIEIDFVTQGNQSGYTITFGGGCAQSGCEGCSSAG